MNGRPTPERPSGRSGVLLFRRFRIPLLALGLVASLGGCDAVIPAGDTVQLDSAAVELEGGARAHVVRIRGFGPTDSIAPATVEAAPGDAVRFIADDFRTHALTFVPDDLEPDARAFLESTGQLRGPPLVNQGSEWVVVLDGAPPGRYPFYCRAHDAGGVLVVRSDD